MHKNLELECEVPDFVHFQISHISSSPELSNRNRFRYHFALLSSDVNLAYGFYGIIRRFQWRRVSIIVQDESLFTVVRLSLCVCVYVLCLHLHTV